MVVKNSFSPECLFLSNQYSADILYSVKSKEPFLLP